MANKKRIQNALIVDGSGNKPFLGSIEIENGMIGRVIPGPSKDFGPDVLDAQGRCLTPGFIDIHRHHDLAALYDPSFGEIELAQGITAAVGGNCGLGAFSNCEKHRAAQFAYIEPCLGKCPADCPIYSFPDYLDVLDHKKLPFHVGMLFGAGACAATVMGYEKRPMTLEERGRAAGLVEEAMQAGALGLSFGIMYHPEAFLAEEDLTALAAAAAKYDGIVTCHMRGEGDSLTESVEEIIRICKRAGARLNISHLKATGVRNWGRKAEEAVRIIEEARKTGQEVAADAYPYTAGATTALSLIPPGVLEGHDLSYLATPSGIRELSREIYRPQKNWDNMVESIGFERIVVGSVTKEENRKYCGKSVKEIADALSLEDPVEWFGPFVAQEEGKVGVILYSMDEKDVEMILSRPFTALISDALYGGGDFPHPRLYGAFPRMLRVMVREKKLLSLEEAVAKMTRLPAERMRLTKMGLIREGYRADVNLFDPEKIMDTATYEDPKRLAEGIDLTLMEGEAVMEGGKLLKKDAGRLLRKKV